MHSSPNTVVIKSKKTSWVDHVGCMGRCAYMILMGTAEGERGNLEELGIDGSVILKVDFKETGWEGRDWINLVHDEYMWWAVVSTVMHACVLYVCVCVCGKFLN